MNRSQVNDPTDPRELEEFERAMRQRHPGDRAVATHPDDERAVIFAVMGGSSRKGTWEPAEQNEVITIMGGVSLDFREADLLEGTTTVRCFALWGGIHIIVPPDVDVDVKGIGLLGGFDHVERRANDENVPRIKIEGIALMGGVRVRVKERTERPA